jgi:hypothetical protein
MPFSRAYHAVDHESITLAADTFVQTVDPW